jgi:acyl dehydratase
MSSNFCYSSLWHPTHSYDGDLSAEALEGETDVPMGDLGFADTANVHRDMTHARGAGLPGPYDYGPQRYSWATQLLTDWIGDAGRIVSLSFQVRDFCFLGDTQRFESEVVRKYAHEASYQIECQLRCVNQRGGVTATGVAVLSLPY